MVPARCRPGLSVTPTTRPTPMKLVLMFVVIMNGFT
jgi:hypothetical protein